METERADQAGLAAVTSSMRQWRQAHPRATLTEIEQELDRQLRTARAALLGELAMSDAATVGTCPDCDIPLRRRGTHLRTLLTDGDQPVPLQRPYATCPVCGRGLFPPWMKR